MTDKPSVGIVITARVQSSRIKQKVLQQIGHKRAIEILLDNLSGLPHEVVLAIPDSAENNILDDIGIERGVLVYRGQDDSPLHRIAAVCREYNFDYIVRITADDILIDREILQNQIRFTLQKQWDYCFIRRCIDGTTAEVIKSDVLCEVAEKMADSSVEFISYYIKNKYRTIEYYPHLEFQHPYRCCLDYPEDLLFLRMLFTFLPEPIKTLDIIHFLKKNAYLTTINRLPDVTVYTCNYNTARYVIDTIDSVLSQSIEFFEYIIIDDCSTDDSVNKIVEKISSLPPEIQKKIRLVRMPKNQGLAYCSNRALEMARGKYIMRVDSDDVIHPDCLKNMLEYIKYDQVDGILSGYTRIDEAGAVFDTVDTNQWHPACSLLSRWACNEIKYREDVKYLDGQFFYEEWRKHFKTGFIPDVLWSYRRRAGQKTQDKEHPQNQ